MTDLDKKVLGAIAGRKLAPRSAAFFLARRSVIWTLAGLSVLLGGASVAVLIFAIRDYLATAGRGFDQLPFDDILGYLPFFWLGVLALLTLCTLLAIRHTRDGYRYRAHTILGISIAASLGLGLLLHVFNAGQRLHEFLQAQLPYYDQLGGPPPAEVTAPDQGQLAGRVISTDGATTIELKAFDGTRWTVDIKGAKRTIRTLAEGEDVDLHGSRTGDHTFKAATVADWD